MQLFKLKTWIKENQKSFQLWCLFIGLSLMITVSQTRGKKNAQPTPPQQIDTFIPEGFVLVPVELSNGPSLKGILETRGVVDLYTGDPTQQKAEKVGTTVKIIRAPENPNYFAVLVPADKAGFLIQRFRPFHAVVKNPHQKSQTFIKPIRRKKSRSIMIELDSSADL